WKSGSLTQTETGTDRYKLLQGFKNVSNAAEGAGPGNLDYSPYGMPFSDAPPAGIPQAGLPDKLPPGVKVMKGPGVTDEDVEKLYKQNKAKADPLIKTALERGEVFVGIYDFVAVERTVGKVTYVVGGPSRSWVKNVSLIGGALIYGTSAKSGFDLAEA